jgi:hypothetical protein
MKRTMFALLAAVAMSAAIPAFSADTPQEEYICRLEARKCVTQMEAVQEKVKKMNEKIEQGATYSEADLKKLQKKLKELNDLLDKMKPVGKK